MPKTISELKGISREFVLKLSNPLFKMSNVMSLLKGKTYPVFMAVHGANQETLEFLKTTDSKSIAEIGVYEGDTSVGIARFLDGRGQLHLYDFADRVEKVELLIRKAGYSNVTSYGNSYKTMDSYNWSLMRVIEKNPDPIYDYVFIDGAHTWSLDALTFFLVDKLVKVGGYIDFDDYSWSLKQSLSMNPEAFPLTDIMYTEEQIAENQIGLVVDLLVKRSNRYRPIVENKIYQKIKSDV